MFITKGAQFKLKSIAWLLSHQVVGNSRCSSNIWIKNIPPRTAFQLLRNMASNDSGNQKTNVKKPRPPKEMLRHVKTREQRKNVDLHGPSTVYVQVIGAGSRGNGASLYVFSEYNRYLFNCGEGTQRLMQEHKVKAARLDNIFLTRMSWENVGGLSGMILTLKDTGVPECLLSGPPQLEKFVNAIRAFSGPLEEIKLAVSPYTAPPHSDNTMTVSQVPIFATLKGNAEPHSSGPRSPSCSPSHSPQGELTRPTDEAGGSADGREERAGSPGKCSVCCRGYGTLFMTLEILGRNSLWDTAHTVYWTFFREVAEGIEHVAEPVGSGDSCRGDSCRVVGPFRSEPDGCGDVGCHGDGCRVVGTFQIRPEDVCTPTDPGPVFLVVECPSEEFVRPLCTNEVLRRYQTGRSEDSAALVVHMTPEPVLETDAYKSWMERFPPGTEHLVLNEHACTVHNLRSRKLQTQLNLIHPEIFPELKSYATQGKQAALHVPNVRAECLLKYQLRPKFEWQRDAILSCDASDFVREAEELPGFLREVEECNQNLTDSEARTGQYRLTDLTDSVVRTGKYRPHRYGGQGSEQDPEWWFTVGTVVFALPMKIRRASVYTLTVYQDSSSLSPTQSVLLDCGEGTFGQLCRHYGNKVDEVLTKLSTVFVSHLHADHHTGLLNVLLQREKALSSEGKPFTPIYLVAPVQIQSWLHQYNDHCQEIMHHINLVPAWLLTEGVEVHKNKTKAAIQSMLRKSDLEKFQTCVVRHCKNAFACSLTHRSGWKLVFSGDTMPCDALVHMGKNASLLIHEATLEDGLEEEAEEKRHSTTSQAIGIGVKMQAEFIMLNHFSQRYAKIPLFSADFSDRVGIAFDHMRVRPSDLRVLPKLTPPLKALFAQEIEEMEERRERRGLRLMREAALEVPVNGQGAAGVAGQGVATERAREASNKREPEEEAEQENSKRRKAS
ncbi:zinc phosphodiesterase ELAC protein 2 [Anguilla rostrata]|uniref:zinc phosphodiesterase ELAC protein 2 n=1 Tax=Anguilla rostrata TaxID=7938 RepID=UPI0030D12C1A